MTREEAKEILNGMSLEDCIKMWNDAARNEFDFYRIIADMLDDTYWNILARKLGTINLIWDVLDSSMDTFNRLDGYVFYDENERTFYSFDDKEEMLKYIEEWFIEEIINRPIE